MIICDACRKRADVTPFVLYEHVQTGPGCTERQLVQYDLCASCAERAANTVAAALREFVDRVCASSRQREG